MAKNDSKKKVQTSVNNQRTEQTNQSGQMYGEMFPAYVNSRADDQRTRAELEDKYRNFTPNYDANAYLGGAGGTAAVGGGGGGGGTGLKAGGINLGSIVGGINPNLITGMGADPYAGYKTMSQGLRPEFWADFNKYMGNFDTANQSLGDAATSYRNFIATGGLSPEQLALYDKFRDTGGFSTQDLQNIRSRSLAPSRAIYQNAQDQLTTKMARAGLNPLAGFGYSNKLQREANEGIGNISAQTEANISEQVQQGRQFGTQGAERIAGMQQQGKLAGTAGLASTGLSQAQVAQMQTNARTQVEELDQQMKAQGLAGMTDIEKARLSAQLTNQQITQAGQIATNQGILSKAQIEAQKASARAGSSAASAALAQRQREFDAQQRFAVQQATNRDMLTNQNYWTNLYGTNPGATQTTGSQLLQLQNQAAGQGINLIGQEIEGSKIPSGFQSGLGNASSILGMLGNAGSAYRGFGGGGSSGGGGAYNPYEYEQTGYGGYNNPIFPGAGGGNSDENGYYYPQGRSPGEDWTS